MVDKVFFVEDDVMARQQVEDTKRSFDEWVKELSRRQTRAEQMLLQINSDNKEIIDILQRCLAEIDSLRFRVLSLELNKKLGGKTKWECSDRNKTKFFTRIADLFRARAKEG